MDDKELDKWFLLLWHLYDTNIRRAALHVK